MPLVKILWKDGIKLDCPQLVEGFCLLDEGLCDRGSFCFYGSVRQAYHSVGIDNGKLRVGLTVFR
jgi:hypothetical protein